MALHEWAGRKRWGTVHLYWMTEIARDLKANLPPGYEAIVGPNDFIAVDVEPIQSDVAVLEAAHAEEAMASNFAAAPAPDFEAEVATIAEEVTLTVVRNSFVVAAIELISPRNKDRPSKRRSCGRRYADYLRNGVNLLIVDVHRRPALFSFPQYIATSFGMTQPMLVAPSAVSFGLGSPLPSGGRMVDVWQRPLVVGEPLPAMTLMLTGIQYVTVNLDATYSRAASDSYLD